MHGMLGAWVRVAVKALSLHFEQPSNACREGYWPEMARVESYCESTHCGKVLRMATIFGEVIYRSCLTTVLTVVCCTYVSG